ncbi:MAG TPA: serine/threonine-protein kinase, partial [Gemmatimonadales bacterium]|nr:serine/threonine-protein kinase [Gemmatimonadales bacterium]
MDPHGATVMVEAEDPEALLQRTRMVLAGEYDVEREIARGGMGVIFKATELGLRRSVALKVLPPELGLSVKTAERFKREGRVVAELDHPNIIPVYRVGQLGGIFFIAMKFIEGRSLGLIVDTQGALPVPVALQVLRGATRALAYAHDRHIVHRDIKGGNILVDQDGRVMISDFGVALRSSDVNLTADGTVIGTPPFMSPEQCAGRRTGPQSDQYSLGIVGFQMLTGSVPFHADTIAGVMRHHFFTPLPDMRRARDDVPETLIAVLNRALEKDPAARFPTTREMLAALEAIPFAEADRRDSERILRRLVQGTLIAKVPTRPLAPLPDGPTAPLAAAAPRPRPTRVRAGVALASVLLLGLVLGVMRLTDRRSVASVDATSIRAPLQTAPTPAPPPATGARQPTARPLGGKLRLLTSPPDAEIAIDGHRVGVGSAFDLPL